MTISLRTPKLEAELSEAFYAKPRSPLGRHRIQNHVPKVESPSGSSCLWSAVGCDDLAAGRPIGDTYTGGDRG